MRISRKRPHPFLRDKTSRKDAAAAEERVMEASTAEIHASGREPIRIRQTGEGSQVRAARLLDAWIAGDRQQLDYELGQWRDDDLLSEREDGREELLLCVVRQMMNEPDLYASRTEKLQIGVWLDMLTRLAEPE